MNKDDKLKALDAAITQIESYDNGWSKVEYKGETGK